MRWIKPARSIRQRLLITLLPTTFALMAAAWLVHGLLLERMTNDFVESRLQDEVAFLEHQLRQSGQAGIRDIADGNYFEEVFHHAFALRVGSEVHISPELWGTALEPLLSDASSGFIRSSSVADSDKAVTDFLAYRRALSINGEPVVIVVAEDLTSLEHSQRELHLWTAVVSAGLLALLVLAIWLAIRLALGSVSQLRDALQALQQGEQTRLDVNVPDEFQPLVKQLNQLLDTLDQRLTRSREALANLSHSIKTPISALRQVLVDDTRDLDLPLRKHMAQRLSDIDRQLEAEMRRSQFAGPQIGKSAAPAVQARDLLWMLGRLYPEKQFELETTLNPDHRWPIEEHDLSEVLGNLLDNAGKWAENTITLRLEENREQLLITVSDDGPGVAPALLSELGTRGMRLDQQVPGHGLGLAIVREITERYEGILAFRSGSRGGLEARVALPVAGSSAKARSESGQ